MFFKHRCWAITGKKKKWRGQQRGTGTKVATKVSCERLYVIVQGLKKKQVTTVLQWIWVKYVRRNRRRKKH